MQNVPWRMIMLLVLLVLVAVFAGFNLGPVDVSVGFHVFEGIPLFLALIVAFILGALIMVPFTFKRPKISPKHSPQTDQKSQRREKKEKSAGADSPKGPDQSG